MKNHLTEEAYKTLLDKAEELQASADELLDLVRLHDPLKRLTVRRIQKVVAVDFKVPLKVMTGNRRGPKAESWARQVAMYLTRDLLNAPFEVIGRAFGGRDHGTVMAACKAVKDQMQVDPSVAKLVKLLSDFLKSGNK